MTIIYISGCEPIFRGFFFWSLEDGLTTHTTWNIYTVELSQISFLSFIHWNPHSNVYLGLLGSGCWKLTTTWCFLFEHKFELWSQRPTFSIRGLSLPWGVKMDATPGRLNQTSFFINRSGLFYGQCSEICGANHSFMPIVLKMVVPGDFLHWLKSF